MAKSILTIEVQKTLQYNICNKQTTTQQHKQIGTKMASGYTKAAIDVDEHWNELNPNPVRNICLNLFIYTTGTVLVCWKVFWLYNLVTGSLQWLINLITLNVGM